MAEYSPAYNSQKAEATKMFINGWVNKQNMVSTYNGVLFGLEKGRKLWSLATTWINLEDLLSEISQLQKDKYCRIPLTWDTQSSKIHRDKSEWWLPGAERKGRGRGSYEWDRALVLQDEKSYGVDGGNGYTIMWMYWMSLNCIHKNSKDDKF